MSYFEALAMKEGVNGIAANPFKLLDFQLLVLADGGKHTAATGGREALLVILGGKATVLAGAKSFAGIGGRPNVFSGLLKLVGGMLMLTLALVMLIRPALLNDLASSLVIFGVALAAVLLVLVLHRTILPRMGIRIGSEFSVKRKHRSQRRNPY